MDSVTKMQWRRRAKGKQDGTYEPSRNHARAPWENAIVQRMTTIQKSIVKNIGRGLLDIVVNILHF